MKKNLFNVVLVLFFTIIFTSFSFGETCPNVTGDWDAVLENVDYNSGTDTFAITTVHVTYHITNQEGCHFYGKRVNKDDPSDIKGVTGVIGERYGNALSIYWTVTSTHFLGSMIDKNTEIKFIRLGTSTAGNGTLTRQ